jgi:UDP-glucose/GDP-mannose dehydrogenase family, NAD binding domain
MISYQTVVKTMSSAVDLSHWQYAVQLKSTTNSVKKQSKSPFRGSVALPAVQELQTQEAGLSAVTEDETPLVAVIGVGYVGLHLVTGFSKHYDVIAFDLSQRRLDSVASELLPNPHLSFTSDPSRLGSATHFLISVPTLLVSGTSVVDTSYLQSAIDTISIHARVGATVVIESSVAVGMTRSLLSEIAVKYNLKAGMSPEVIPFPPTRNEHQLTHPASASTQVVPPPLSNPSQKSSPGSTTSRPARLPRSKSSTLPSSAPSSRSPPPKSPK